MSQIDLQMAQIDLQMSQTDSMMVQQFANHALYGASRAVQDR